jgi:hypothetical protein
MFLTWWDIWEQPLFGAKEVDSDDSNTNMNRQQDNKGKEAKGR